MSETLIQKAVSVLKERFDDVSFDGSAKFEIEGEGTLIIDEAGVREVDPGAEAQVTLSAEAEVFQQIITGELNPTNAFMSGQLRLDGDMGVAMRLAGVLG